MKASPTAAVTYIVPGEVIASTTKGGASRKRRAYIRGVLSSVSEFISVYLPTLKRLLIVDDAS